MKNKVIWTFLLISIALVSPSSQSQSQEEEEATTIVPTEVETEVEVEADPSDNVVDEEISDIESREEWIEEAGRLIQAGDDHIEYDEHFRDVILMAGNSGTGKSTLVKILTTDDNATELESYWSGDRYLIRDKEGTISTASSTIVSKTIYPKLIINRKTQMAFYDLPGFGDTRGAATEMANADFMKRVADRARRVSIIFVVNYSSLKSSGTRTEFLNLLESAIAYVKNPKKFRSAIAIIANKVPAHIPHKEIIPGISQFLKNAQESLTHIMIESPEGREGSERKRKKMHSLISALFKTKGKLLRSSQGQGQGQDSVQEIGSSRIGYVKVPDQEGLLREFPETARAKNALSRIISKKFKLVLKSSTDFGMSITPSTLLFLLDSIRDIQSTVAELSLELSRRITSHFKNIQGSLYNRIDEYSRDFNLVQNQLSSLKNPQQDQEDGGKDLYKRTASFFNDIVQGLNLTDDGLVENLEANVAHLHFLQPFISRSNSNNSATHNLTEEEDRKILSLWTRPVEAVLRKIDRNIFVLGQEVNGVVLSTVSVVASKFRGLYTVRLNNLYDLMSADSSGSRDKSVVVLDDLKKDAAALKLAVSHLLEVGSLQEFLNETKSGLSTTSLALASGAKDSKGEFKKEYEQLLELPLQSDIPLVMRPYRESPFSQVLWAKPLESLAAYLDEERSNLEGIVREADREKEIRISKQKGGENTISSEEEDAEEE